MLWIKSSVTFKVYNFLGWRNKSQSISEITLWRNFENRMIFDRVAGSWKNTVGHSVVVIVVFFSCHLLKRGYKSVQNKNSKLILVIF